MAISPPGGGGPPGSKFTAWGPVFGPHPRAGSSTSKLSDEERAAQSEKEANRRVAAAEQEIHEAERDGAYQLERQRTQDEQELTAETVRHEGALETQKNKGYEQIRELQRQQQAELGRLRRDGDREEAKLRNYYRDTNYATERKGKEQLQELERGQMQRMDYQERMGTMALGDAQRAHEQRVEQLRETDQEKFDRLADASRKEYERMHETYLSGNEGAERKFQEKFNATVASQRETLEGLENHASAKIREVRRDTAQKLAAYSSRQRDPFYRLVDMNARLYDEGDHYLLVARIPEHERHHVSVSVKGNNLMLSGNRRNEEKLEVEPGHTVGTSAFQSFNETFPLSWPVESKLISKEYRGDEIYVTVPKKNEYAFAPQAPQSKPERARVEKPRFPENLPHVADEPVPDPDAPKPGPSPRNGWGSRTLS